MFDWSGMHPNAGQNKQQVAIQNLGQYKIWMINIFQAPDCKIHLHVNIQMIKAFSSQVLQF